MMNPMARARFGLVFGFALLGSQLLVGRAEAVGALCRLSHIPAFPCEVVTCPGTCTPAAPIDEAPDGSRIKELCECILYSNPAG